MNASGRVGVGVDGRCVFFVTVSLFSPGRLLSTGDTVDWAIYLWRLVRNREGYLVRKVAKRAAAGIDTSDIRLDDDCGSLNNDRGSEDDKEGVLGRIDDY